MNGQELRDLREDRKLSRNEVADATGLTLSAIARVETRDSFKEGEHDALVDYYGVDPNGAESATEESTGEPEIDEFGKQRYRLWRGVKEGDIVRIAEDDAGRYTFRALVIPANGTRPYVDCTGGVGGHIKARTPGAHKVTTANGKVLWPLEEQDAD